MFDVGLDRRGEKRGEAQILIKNHQDPRSVRDRRFSRKFTDEDLQEDYEDSKDKDSEMHPKSDSAKPNIISPMF